VLSGIFNVHEKLVNYDYLSWKWSYVNDLLNTVGSQKMISKDETISSNRKVVTLLPIATTRVSHEFGREHNQMMHYSSSETFISIDNNWLTTILKAFRCSVTETPSFILRLDNFFHRNNLFTRDLDWYKVPKLSHKTFVEASIGCGA